VKHAFTRRRLLSISVWLPAIRLLQASARAAGAADTAPVCVDRDEAGDGLRKSLHYAEVSPDQRMTCSGCQFFTAGGADGCGQCQIMNAAASARGHCDSWSKKQ
jgi:high potential iron-sulfur protein